MGLLTDLFEKRAAKMTGGSPQSPSYWVQKLFGGGGNTASGVAVDEQSALSSTAVWRAVSLVSQTVGALPLHLYEREGERAKKKAIDHHLYRALHDEPNPEQTAMEFREMLQAHALTWGRAHAEIVPNGYGRLSLWPIVPDRVRQVRTDRGIRYEVQLPNGEKRVLLPEDMFTLRGLGYGRNGSYNVIELFRESIGLTLAVEEFGARFFGNGATMGGVLEHPGALGDEAFKHLSESMNERHRGLSNAHRLLILEEGAQYKQIAVPPDQAQFLECVVPGTPVNMADGTRKLVEDLRVGDEVIGWDNGPVVSRVNGVGVPPVKQLVRITTARGRTLTATFDHPCLVKENFKTPGGACDYNPGIWKHIGDIRAGEHVSVGLGNTWDGNTGDTKIAWLLGALVGDGYIRSMGCSFSNQSSGVLEEVEASLSLLGASLKQTSEYNYDIKTGGRGCKGSPFRTLINESNIVDQGAANKRVPLSVMQGGPSVWAAFLSGYLDTDGSVTGTENKGQPLAYWSSINRELLEDCQHLLALLNINSAIYLMKKEHAKEINGKLVRAKDQWGLYVTGASQLVKLANVLSPADSGKAERLVEFLGLPPSRYRDINWEYDRVISVEYLGEGETIGVEIDGCHTFITGGLVTHNSRKFQINDVSRIMGVPPHKLAEMSAATYSNVEFQGIEYVQDTINPWCVRWEQALARQLLSDTEKRRYFWKHNLAGLVRGDFKTRMDGYAVGRQNGWLSANDIREMEDMNPVDHGDIYLVPLNMIPADAAASPPVPGEGRSEKRSKRAASSRRRLADSYKRLFSNAVGEVIKRERADVMREAERQFKRRSLAQFDEWLVEFYEEHKDFIRRKVGPVYESLAEAIQAEAAEEMGADPGMTERHELFTNAYIDKFAARHTARSLSRMQEKAAEPEPIEAMEAEFDQWEETRVDGIANEEAVQASNAFAKHAFVLGGVTKLMWVAGSDACPFCQEMDGKIVGVEDNFLAGGGSISAEGEDQPMSSVSNVGHPPLHSGCLCSISPVM